MKKIIITLGSLLLVQGLHVFTSDFNANYNSPEEGPIFFMRCQEGITYPPPSYYICNGINSWSYKGIVNFSNGEIIFSDYDKLKLKKCIQKEVNRGICECRDKKTLNYEGNREYGPLLIKNEEGYPIGVIGFERYGIIVFGDLGQ